MLSILRLLMRCGELVYALPVRAVRILFTSIVFNPRLGPLRHVFTLVALFVLSALVLVYVVAPVRGIVGQYYQGEKLRYDAERWLATAIYDANGYFVGTFDPRLDSRGDFNHTDRTIEIDDYAANPDHKSIPVREVPDAYWRCLVFHEDRHIGGWLNPFGIDLSGVLKMPVTSIQRSIASRRLVLGVGGSTLPMQFARVIYKTPPSSSEGPMEKIRRKFGEWWLAPVIYRELTLGGDDTPLKQWAANHLWLAQRTGGSSLHGVEVTSRIVFGKEAKDLTTAEQFVLASAVNKPIILLTGSDRLNEVRIDRWRYITEVRAKACADSLITDAAEQKAVYFELIGLAGGPPDPRVRPRLHEALERHAPQVARRAEANPVTRANALMPSARFGLREEMKAAFGNGWREHVRGVASTLDATGNLGFHRAIEARLAELDKDLQSRLNPGWTLDPAKIALDRQMPQVVVAAANHKGEIVRYFESHETTPYFGSPHARDAATGAYGQEREGRMIASIGKILVAVGIANEGRDTPASLYLDTQAPKRGLETCRHDGSERRGRKAEVAFACSLNEPLLNRAARLGQPAMQRLIDGFGFNMPPTNADGEGTPPSTAAVLGQISGSPRRVHQMAGVILASLTGQDSRPVRPPTLVKEFDFTTRESAAAYAGDAPGSIVPRDLIDRSANGMIQALLQAPLCYEAYKTSYGTMKSLAAWCPSRRGDLRLHFAKTGTQVSEDPDATIDTWVAGGLQFANGAAYSYVVLVGTGSAGEIWGRNLHASQTGTRLLEILLNDLAAHAKDNPQTTLLPRRQVARPVASADQAGPAPPRQKGYRPLDGDEMRKVFGLN